MVDTWAIADDVTWSYDPAADGGKGADVQTVTPLFSTAGRLTEHGTAVSEAEAGERTVVETHRELHIPWNSPAAPVNAVAQCTAIHPTTDPTLLGTIVRLSGPVPATQKTARRLQVTETLT